MHKLKQLVPQSIKNIYHLAQAIAANIYYGFPSHKLKVIGVTGTDGKTTTVQMITKILEEADKKVAMASTINFSINEKEEKNLSHFTTESSFAIQKFIARAVRENCEYLVLETSSHSLDQYRVWGVKYQTALVTNITREHLDYHKDMKKYRSAKKRLFTMVARNEGSIIVNLDMENPNEFLKFDVENKFGYSTGNSGLQISDDKLQYISAGNVELGINYSKYTLNGTSFTLHIPGLFNIENALAATCLGLSEGIDLETMQRALEKIKGVAGRMEAVPNEKGLNIIVDFALTPNALDNLYSLLSNTRKSDAKIIAVLGSCGERDRGKRPIMGKIVSQYADFIVLTNDEPYNEDPQTIIEEIAAGIKDKEENVGFWKIPDRREAIWKALQLAGPGDVVAVTGMGNFESMIIGNEKIPWNDRAVILEELKKLA